MRKTIGINRSEEQVVTPLDGEKILAIYEVLVLWAYWRRFIYDPARFIHRNVGRAHSAENYSSETRCRYEFRRGSLVLELELKRSKKSHWTMQYFALPYD